MATIKDVARLAGVSPTTVSIVLNGKAEARKISKATCQQIQEAIRKLGYQPDQSARRLRRGGKQRPIIAFFWPLDHRLRILSSLINAASKELTRQDRDCEIAIQTFQNDQLSKSPIAQADQAYNAVIIGACSKHDVEYLESLSLQIPVVLINRNSMRYSTVQVDNDAIGQSAAQMLYSKGHRSAGVIAAEDQYLQSERRTQAFLKEAETLGIKIRSEHILYAPDSMAGGASAATMLAVTAERPPVIFCESDTMAIGALNTFIRLNISIPRSLEVLSIAMLDEESALYCVPSLSVIALPNEEIAAEAMRIALQLYYSNSITPIHLMLDSKTILRDSFRLPSISQ